jgi:hypothetical protein
MLQNLKDRLTAKAMKDPLVVASGAFVALQVVIGLVALVIHLVAN